MPRRPLLRPSQFMYGILRVSPFTIWGRIPFRSEVDRSHRGVLTTDRTSYRPGEQGAVTLRNDGSRKLGYNLCRRQLEQQVGDAWVVRERSPGPEELCTTELRFLEPGATAKTGFRLPRALPAGVCRWRFWGVGDSPVPQGLRGERLSNSFRVEP